MTNEHYLEVAKECGAVIHSDGNIFFTNVTKLSAYTARICAEKDAEIERLQAAWDSAYRQAMENGQKLSAANAAIAMKDSILNDFFNSHSEMYSASPEGREYLAKIQDALSTSPESIAAWEAEKLLPLQRQVAMLVKEMQMMLMPVPAEGVTALDVCKAISARAEQVLSNTQATAEAYDRELTEPLRKRIAELEAKK